MKRKMKLKKLAAFSILICILAGTAACSSEKTAPKENGPETSKATEVSSQPEEESPDGLPWDIEPLASPVTLKSGAKRA